MSVKSWCCLAIAAANWMCEICPAMHCCGGGGGFKDTEIQAALEQVAQATAVVVATPVYKAAYRGLLKEFLDLLPQFGLTEKVVLPLATGGSRSHMLALDYTLRQVLSSLAAKHVLQCSV